MENSKKIRIAFFTDVLRENTDGVTYTLHNIIQKIPRDRFECLFITAYPPLNMETFPFPVYICRYIQFPLYQEYPFVIPDFDPRLNQVLDEFKPDLIHFTTPALLGRFALKYALAKGIPPLTTYHTHFIAYVDYYFKYLPGIKIFIKWLVKKIMLWFYNRCDLVFVPTDTIRDELIEIGIDKSRLTTWSRGVDMEKHNPSFRDTDYIDSICGKNTKKVLFVSRLVWEKEIQTLMDLHKLFARSRPDIKMVITGDGPQKKKMKKKMPGAVFTGKLHNRDLARIYASCDVFVFPSITETFGNVVLEAMASGLPVVVAGRGGPAGIVKNGATGFHAIPRNAADFYEKITALLDDPALYKKISDGALSYAGKQKWEVLCSVMFQTYENIYSHHIKDIFIQGTVPEPAVNR